MKIIPNEEFRAGRELLEPGNTYDSTKHGWTDSQIARWHAAGWCEVEGWDKAPERKPGAQSIRPAKTRQEG